MGQSFERILVQEKGMMHLTVSVKNAMAELGYIPAKEGQGVSICYRQMPDSEWFDFSSPLLETGAEAAEPLKQALSKAFRTPLLHLSCIDSDFMVCRLMDEAHGIDTVACINKPYEGLTFDAPNYEDWAAACKKKWRCQSSQFQSIFESRYTFAEEGLESLAKLLHFSPVDEVAPDSFMQATDWFVPKEGAVASSLLRTLSEQLSEYMEREYAPKLEKLGYRRYRNSPVRWHKLVGVPGNELLLSMVFVVRYNEIEPMYGAQSLYCPLTLSDKYYPLHDDEEYWKEARFEYGWKFGLDRDPLRDTSGPVTVVYSLDLQKLAEFIDALMLPELEAVRSLSDCHTFFLTSRKCSFVASSGSKVRLWIEAALAGDEPEAQRWYEQTKSAIEKSAERFGRIYDDLEHGMIKAYEAGGCEALISYLLSTVYRENLRKLKRAGIVE